MDPENKERKNDGKKRNSWSSDRVIAKDGFDESRFHRFLGFR